MRSPALSGGLRRAAAASFFGAAALLAAAASADDADAASGGTVVERLLDILLEQKSITRSQYDELLAQARREAQSLAAPPADAARAESLPAVAAAGAEAPREWSAGWNNGVKLERSDGAFQLGFTGRIHLDGALIEETEGLDDDLRALGGNGQGDGVELRRARIGVNGTVYENLFFSAQYEFSSGEADFKDVLIGMTGLGPVGTVQVGQFKEPMFLEEMNSANNIVFMERALNSAFFPDRNVGLMASNTLAGQRFLWQAAVFRGADSQGRSFSSFHGTDWDAILRVSGVPLWSDEGRRMLHLGGTYLHRFRGENVRYRQRPASHLADYFVDTASIAASGADLVNLELAWEHGPFLFQAEYTHSFVEGDQGQKDVDFGGAYAQVSWFLTGENHPYELGKGRFGRVKPRASFDLAKGDWGAWEIAARASFIDLDDRNIRGGRLWDVVAGINWYLFPNARIMLNYVHADLSGREAVVNLSPIDVTGRADIVQTRFQVDF